MDLLEEEAEEVTEELDNSSSDNGFRRTTNGTENKKRFKSSKVRSFAGELLLQATEGDWDDAELAKLTVLNIQVLGLKHRAAWRLINAAFAESATPAFLSKLKDEGLRTTASNVLTLLQLGQTSREKLLSLICECIEQHVLDLQDDETLPLLVALDEGTMSNDQRTRYAAMLCEQCSSKKQAGRVLSQFVSLLSVDDAAAFVHEVVEYDFFLDLKGSMEGFFRQFGDIRETLKERLQQITANEEGVWLQDSDEDDAGNLRGFVVDDAEPILESSGSEDDVKDRKRLRMKRRAPSPVDTADDATNGPRRRRKVVIEESDDDVAPQTIVKTSNPLARLGHKPSEPPAAPAKTWLHAESRDEEEEEADSGYESSDISGENEASEGENNEDDDHNDEDEEPEEEPVHANYEESDIENPDSDSDN